LSMDVTVSVWTRSEWATRGTTKAGPGFHTEWSNQQHVPRWMDKAEMGNIDGS
jgi:hypothetical protein